MSATKQADKRWVPVTDLMHGSANCALAHTWTVDYRTFRAGLVKRQGKRPYHQFETVVSNAKCPTCGHRWVRLKASELAMLAGGAE